MANDQPYERQIVLDTETTGLEHRQGHRIIEIGCVELINRQLTGNNYQVFLNPEREIDKGAIDVHGISNEFLLDKALFADIYPAMLEYLQGAELIIHNAKFDVAFLDAELARADPSAPSIEQICTVYDTLSQARKIFPGQRNDLNSLCKRYAIDSSHRIMHGALLDAEILADVYLAMTGGQTSLSLEVSSNTGGGVTATEQMDYTSLVLPVVNPTAQEQQEHADWLARLDTQVDGQCVWTKINTRS